MHNTDVGYQSSKWCTKCNILHSHGYSKEIALDHDEVVAELCDNCKENEKETNNTK